MLDIHMLKDEFLISNRQTDLSTNIANIEHLFFWTRIRHKGPIISTYKYKMFDTDLECALGVVTTGDRSTLVLMSDSILFPFF